MAQIPRELYSQGDTAPAGRLLKTDTVTVPDELVNRDTIAGKARAARARMQQIASAGNLTTAQQQQAIKDVARVCANLIPLLLSETTDPGD